MLTATRLQYVSAQDAPLAIPASQWAKSAAQSELAVLKFDNTYLRYTVHIVDSRGDKVRDVIESKDGTVARLILISGRPLTHEEDEAERSRLQAMLDSPAAFARHIKTDETGKKYALDLIAQVPDAMTFVYAPGQPQRPSHSTSAPAEIVIDFTPNPQWNPPTMTAEALTGLRGRVWIDPATHHLTRLEGEIFRGINLGWGLFAHVFPGGTLTFDQVQVTGQRWIFSHFTQHVTVRALLVKTFRQNAEITGSSYTPISTLSYQDAIHLLLATPLPH